MADAGIVAQIRAFLTPVFEKQTCILKFTYNERLYVTKFAVTHTAAKIQLANDCVNVSYDLDRREWKGGILADSPERACFEPILTTNARTKVGKRTTSADVLQILKTKLCLACPVEDPVMIIDQANTPTTMISPFHLLRGGDAFYEKYGYHSAAIGELKDGLRTFTWSECSPEMIALIREYPGMGEFPPTTLLIDILKGVTWDQESDFNGIRGSAWSADLLELYAMKVKGYTSEQMNQFSPVTLWKYTLNQEDARWITANASMVFTDFTVVVSGGSRTRRKRRRSVRRRR